MDSPTPIDSIVMHRAANILETLVNLNYLIREDANDAEKVRAYAVHVDERLALLTDVLGPWL